MASGTTPRRYRGWAPRTEISYEYDDEGRLTREVHQQEAEWTDEDRAAYAAMLDLNSDTCAGCGLPVSKTIPRTDLADLKTAQALSAYWAKFPDEHYQAGFFTCRGCLALASVQSAQAEADEKITKDGGKVFPQARHWVVYERPEEA